MADRDVVADEAMTAKEVDKMKASFELDLIAFFRVLNEDVVSIVEAGAKDGKTPEEIVQDVEALFGIM